MSWYPVRKNGQKRWYQELNTGYKGYRIKFLVIKRQGVGLRAAPRSFEEVPSSVAVILSVFITF